MTNVEKQELIERTLALSEEEAQVIAGAMPTYILWNEIGSRLTDLQDFRNRFDNLSDMTKKIPL